MKLFIAIIIVLSAAPSVKDRAVLSFYEKAFAFPDVKEGVVLSHEFEFINSGDQPLIIDRYAVACSCTKAFFSKEPILPGGKSSVKIEFDTNDKYGYQNRIIEVYSNASKKPQKLKIKVVVIPKVN